MSRFDSGGMGLLIPLQKAFVGYWTRYLVFGVDAQHVRPWIFPESEALCPPHPWGSDRFRSGCRAVAERRVHSVASITLVIVKECTAVCRVCTGDFKQP